MKTLTSEELKQMLDKQTIVYKDEKVTVIEDGEGNTLRICTKCRGRLRNDDECWWCNRPKFSVTHTDSRSIVRCKDCTHYNAQTKGCKRNPSVEGWYADDFCSYGKESQ